MYQRVAAAKICIINMCSNNQSTRFEHSLEFFFFFDPIGACFVYQSVALRVHVGVWVRCNKHRGSRRIVFFHATPRFSIFFFCFVFALSEQYFLIFGMFEKMLAWKRTELVCVWFWLRSRNAVIGANILEKFNAEIVRDTVQSYKRSKSSIHTQKISFNRLSQ